MSAAKRRSGLLTAGAVLWRSFDYLLLTHSGCILAFRAPALILCKMGIPFIPPRKVLCRRYGRTRASGGGS